MMKLRTSFVFVPAALALAFVAYAEEPEAKPETIVVQGTRAHFEVPKEPAARPPMPDLKLKLPAYTLESRDYIWPSGLRMVFQADHSQPVVAITTVYDRGSSADPLGKEGIAHFVEHMWFRSQHVDASDPSGAKRLPKVWDILSDLGCDLNASTADDWTNYMSVCPATSLPALLRLESLRLDNAVEGVEASVVDTERDVIRNELRMRYENDDFGNVMPYLFQKMYPEGHPYSRLGIGTHESLFNCKLEDIQKFVKDNYVPANTTITVVGDFDLADVPRLISENIDPKFLVDPKNPDAPLKLMESMPPRVDKKAPIAEPPKPRDQTMGIYEANVEQPLVVLGWTVPGAYHGMDDNYRVAANIASFYIASYFENVAPDPNVDTNAGVGCFLWDSKVDSKVICVVPLKKSADLEKVNPTSIAQRAADQIATMWNPDEMLTGGLTTFLDRSKMQNLASILESLDLFATVGGGRATDIAHHLHYTGSVQAHSDMMNDTMSINPQAIVDFAYKYLRRERMVNVFLKPIPEDELAVDANQGSDYVAAEDGVVRSTVDPKEITAEVIQDFTIMPQTDLIQEKVLPNGLRIAVLEHGEAPLVQAGLFVNGGMASSENTAMDDFAEVLTDTMWDDWNPMNRKIDPLRIAGYWGQDAGNDYTYQYVQSASGNLDGALWFLREAVEEMQADADGRVQYVKDWKGALKAQWKEREFWEQEALDRHVYGNSRLGRLEGGILPWEDAVTAASIPTSETLAYMHQKYQPKNTTLLVVGNVDAEDTLALAEYYFQGWTPEKGVTEGVMPPIPKAEPVTDAPEVLIFDHAGRTQTNVSWACPIAAAGPENDALRGVLTDYLDEQAWIILRENGGVTYGAGAYAIGNEDGSAGLYMNSLVQNDGVVLAIKTFQELAKRAEDGKFDTDRLQIHKLNRGKKQVNRQQSIPQMVSRLKGPLMFRQPWSWLAEYPTRLAAVAPADLQKAMGDCSDHYVITLNGPKEALEPGLTAAGIAYKVFDYKQARKDMLAKYDPKSYQKLIKAEAKAEAKKAKDAAKEPAPVTPAPEAPAPQ